MENPWKEIKNKEYVLLKDQERIKEFNINTKTIEHKIQTQLIPDPFFGNKDAKVILLMLNPGFGGKEVNDYKEINNFEEILLNNLKHANTQRHFFSLNETFAKSEAFKYWSPKVKELNTLKFDNNFLSEKIFCINLFPYHSEKYKKLKGELLESQKYALYLLNEAIKKDDSLIISMRSYAPWAKAYSAEYKEERAFDDLVNDRKMLRISSYGNPTLSKRNLLQKDGFDGFEKLISKLKEPIEVFS